MKKVLLFALSTAVVAASGVAQASTGNIKFTGAVNSSSCVVSPGAGSSGAAGDIAVMMGTVSLNDLSTSTGTDFGGAANIGLDIQCDSGMTSLSTLHVRFDPLSGSGIDSDDPRLLKLDANGAKGVGIAIINGDHEVINLSDNQVIDAPLEIDGDKATANLSMRAAYVLTGVAAEAGPANASMPFTVTYD